MAQDSKKQPDISRVSSPPKRMSLSRHPAFVESPGLSENGPATTKSVDHRRDKSLDMLMRENYNENSPLIRPAGLADDGASISPLPSVMSPDDESDDDIDWEHGHETEESKSSWYLFLLTVAIGGLQICWSVELAYGSPYLLGLGISKSLLAFVWIAGPLSGTLVQPYVGVKSDRCRLPWGKRRPFMVGGALATIISLFCLAWAREIIAGILGIFGVDSQAQAVNTVAIVFAVIVIYVLDFAINVIQAAVRAFIVDNAPAHQQNDANAWASRISGIGNILGYISGYVDLPKILPFFGDTQFKVLCVIACLALGLTVTLSVLSIRERDPRLEGELAPQKGGVVTFFVELYHSIRHLPPQIMKVCQVQFFAWIGWFPFLFYTTTFVAGIYADPYFRENPNLTPAEVDAIWNRGTRVASFSLLIFAITTFSASVFLPLFLQPVFRPPGPPSKTPLTPAATTPGSYAAPVDYFSRPADKPGKTRKRKGTFLQRAAAAIPSLKIPGLTIRRLYVISHLLFTLATFLTPLVHNTIGATVLIGFIGIPWAVTNWAPYAIIAAEIGKREAIRRGTMRPSAHDEEGQLLADGEDPSDGADQAGVVLGIHNVAIAAPQVIATLVSSVIFKIFQKPRGQPGDDSVGWVLRFGGVAAIMAAILATRIKEERG
ncbi:MFS general substrate transporter [Myriangium duriaei CBS 260.36]|uniref:MFS general substrate transporter n=1 Tax=Myriangium duriaei CBS 260.36 TaxID=1168546 RepID=A0A9P4JAP8_9PEZI|nr:MFS general substrate transporter [Myriangium duriaei CBS 260.36]